MKRQKSPGPLEREEKRVRADEALPSPIDLASKPQERSMFFQLSRKLRDQKFAVAFGTETMRIVHNYLQFILRSPCFMVEFVTCGITRGLPKWVLSGKKTSHEATEVLARTWWFEMIDTVPENIKGYAISSPLVFNQSSIRNLVVQPWMYQSPDVSPGDSKI
jgi:hypothetical protein